MTATIITEEPKFLIGSNDRVFKTLVNSGEKGKIILEAVLSAVFEENVEVIEFLSVELPLDKTSNRRKILDCLVKVKDKFVNVEINLNDYDAAKAVRNFAYLCSFYSQNTRKGNTYDTETLCVQVNINFGSSPYNRSNKIMTKAYMRDEDGIVINNFSIWNMYVENIKHICYNNPKERDKYRYILMLDEDRNSLDSFYPEDNIVSIYKGELMRLNSDADLVWDLTKEEDDEKLFNTRMYLAEKEGKAKGLAEGITEGMARGIEQNTTNVIKNMLKLNMSIEDIAKVVELNKKEVEKIITTNNLN